MDAITEKERKLGFIAPLYDAVTHADNIRQDILDKSVAPESVMRAWRACWHYDSKAQQDYARDLFRRRGYFVYDAQSCVKGLPHHRMLVTYLD